ncbi:MAG: hypothetical protein R6V03_02435 [Kiritimatiellia bacterium]
MRAVLDRWRKDSNVQYNSPNPEVDEDMFQSLYVDTDPSKFDPLTANRNEWERIRQWRRGMNKAVSKDR